MGWSETKGKGMWGDDPQDIVDKAVANLTKMNYSRREALPVKEKRQWLVKIAKNRVLRKKVDAEYQRAWHRPATDREFRNLIKVALRLQPNYTVGWRR